MSFKFKKFSFPNNSIYKLLLISICFIFLTNQNNINFHNLNGFIENIEICGDKYLSLSETGEVHMSIDLGYNWTKLENIQKIKKIISFEGSNINKEREKFKKRNKYTYDFLKNLLLKKLKNENYQNDIKLSVPEENSVFITENGEIIFSKNCGFDQLEKSNEKISELNPKFNENIIVKDYIFHPYNQENGLIIAYDDENNFFDEDKQKIENFQVFLTENFGKTFKRIKTNNNEELKRFVDFTW